MLDGNDTSHIQQYVFITRGNANTWSSVILKEKCAQRETKVKMSREWRKHKVVSSVI